MDHFSARHVEDTAESPDLSGMTLTELERFFESFGKERYRAVQVMKWIHQRLAPSFHVMTNLSKQLREDLSSRARIICPEVVEALVSGLPQ